jgi:hypothetical protein
MPDCRKGLPGHPYTGFAVVAGALYCPHLTATQLVALLVWLAPDWGRKVLKLAASYRRFRAGRGPDQ